MLDTLKRDEFFGHRLGTRAMGPFSLSLTRYERGTVIPWHAHRESYATVVVSGAYREDTDGGSRHCQPRNIVVHARDERHADAFVHGSATCLNVHGTAFNRSALLSRPQMDSLAMKLIEEFRHPDSLSSMSIEALMLELFVTAERDVRHRDTPPHWLEDVRRVVTARFQEPLTLTDLGRTAGIHPAHVARAFRQHYGTTVGGMLRELRVAYVRQRLTSMAPLREIALDAGFADQSHLTRTFRRSTGVTPAAYRRTLR